MILQVLPQQWMWIVDPLVHRTTQKGQGFLSSHPNKHLFQLQYNWITPLIVTRVLFWGPLQDNYFPSKPFFCVSCHFAISSLTRPSLPYHFHSFIFSLSTCVYRKNLHLQNECGVVAAAAVVVFETLELRVLVGFVFDACLFQSKKKLNEGGLGRGGSWEDGVVCQYLHLPFTSSSPNPSQSPLDIGYLFHGNGSSPVHTQKLPLVKRPFPLLSSLSFISFYMCRSYPTPMPSFPLYLYSNSSHQSKIFHAYCLNLTIIQLS